MTARLLRGRFHYTAKPHSAPISRRRDGTVHRRWTEGLAFVATRATAVPLCLEITGYDLLSTARFSYSERFQKIVDLFRIPILVLVAVVGFAYAGNPPSHA